MILEAGFFGHHKAHVALLSGTVAKLGGTPASAKDNYNFPVDQLKTELDVLKLAARLEQGAVPLFANRDISKAAASILGDEATQGPPAPGHWRNARGAFSFHDVMQRCDFGGPGAPG